MSVVYRILLGAAALAFALPSHAQKTRTEIVACTFGPFERQVRFAMEWARGKPQSVAFWSSSGSYRCSFDAKRDDAFSKWADYGNSTLVTLLRGNGATLIEKEHNVFLIRVKELDRMRFCGTEGEINGVLTITRTKTRTECRWEGPYAKDDD